LTTFFNFGVDLGFLRMGVGAPENNVKPKIVWQKMGKLYGQIIKKCDLKMLDMT
jgi:hypothetical protein